MRYKQGLSNTRQVVILTTSIEAGPFDRSRRVSLPVPTPADFLLVRLTPPMLAKTYKFTKLLNQSKSRAGRIIYRGRV